MDRKDELKKIIEEAKAFNSTVSERAHKARKDNSAKFGAILPETKYLKYDMIDLEYYTKDRIYSVSFGRNFSLNIFENGAINYFSTSGLSGRNPTEAELDEVINYTYDITTMISFFRTNQELVAKTIASFTDVAKIYEESKSCYNEEQELRKIEHDNVNTAKTPEKGKWLVLLETNHTRDGYRTYRYLVQVVSKTKCRFTFKQVNYSKDSLQNYEETKAIDFDKLDLPNEEDLKIIANLK